MLILCVLSFIADLRIFPLENVAHGWVRDKTTQMNVSQFKLTKKNMFALIYAVEIVVFWFVWFNIVLKQSKMYLLNFFIFFISIWLLPMGRTLPMSLHTWTCYSSPIDLSPSPTIWIFPQPVNSRNIDSEDMIGDPLNIP